LGAIGQVGRPCEEVLARAVCLGPDASSIGHVVLFACGLVELGPRIDRNREITIRIKTGTWNKNWSEDSAFAGGEGCRRNILSPTRYEAHSRHRGRSIPLPLILDDGAQLFELLLPQTFVNVDVDVHTEPTIAQI